MVIYDNKVVLNNGRWIIGYREPEPPPPPPPPVYNVILNQTTGGTISASPMSGIDGTTVTLSNSPSTNYTFNGYTISGSTLYNNNKFNINGSDVTCSASWKYVDPYNPLNLPPYTIRFKYKPGTKPRWSSSRYTKVLVDEINNIWDMSYVSNDWRSRWGQDSNMLEVLGANTTGITNMDQLFCSCTSLKRIALFDTSSVTRMQETFRYTAIRELPLFDTSKVTLMDYICCDCHNLTTVPLLNTSKCTNFVFAFYNCYSLQTFPIIDTSKATTLDTMFQKCSSLIAVPLLSTASATTMSGMFDGCTNVRQGALALYNQAKSQTRVPDHKIAFSDCGINTQSGSAELAQIPNDWKVWYN